MYMNSARYVVLVLSIEKNSVRQWQRLTRTMQAMLEEIILYTEFLLIQGSQVTFCGLHIIPQALNILISKSVTGIVIDNR